MKKAVSLWNAFLKKAKRNSTAEKEEDVDLESKVSESARSENEHLKVSRTSCARCVFVYEKKLWNEYGLTELFKPEDLTESDFIGQRRPLREDGDIENTLSLLRFYGIVPKRKSFDAWCTLTHVRLQCLLEHFWSTFHLNLTFDSHCPTLVWITESAGGWRSPFIYEDSDMVLLNLSLAILCSLADHSLPMTHVGAATNVEVWALLRKFPKPAVSLAVEEDLNTMSLDQNICFAFLSLPSSMEERYQKLEEIFQAVDKIISIASCISMASGNEGANLSTVKEVIIETATVVTSTAAESTATVGIETAAMALGQAAAGVAISVLVDIALTAGSVTRAKLQRDKGLISNSQFKSVVRRRLCDSGCQFIGGTTGTIVGQVLIPVPVVGAIVGGFFGSLIGVGVSKGIMKTSEIISKAQTNRMKALANK